MWEFTEYHLRRHQVTRAFLPDKDEEHTVGATAASKPLTYSFRDFYHTLYLSKRKQKWTKLSHFFGNSLAAWVLIWGVYGGNITQTWKSLLLAVGIRNLSVLGSVILFEIKPSLTDHWQHPLWVLLADLRLWIELLFGLHDVWPHFGEIETTRD
ncbi:unnamed protein product [Amoebophrya sp. A120]|nr:unnamed protein product [Amoebophrya sp. A120]|eukprot:GSA120T00010665001.1